jgi:ankyrin repeat protein
MGGDANEVRQWLEGNLDEINVNWQDPTNHDRTLPMYAVVTGNKEIVRMIRNLPGIDLTQTDREGHTALFYAQTNRNSKIIQLLQP